ncbi:MAG: NRDE family protein [Candidatus Binatia bacterium]
MCTLAVYSRSFREYPLVIAANRDEFYDRESLEPALLPGELAVYCGRDGIHSGTWLGVNAAGVAAALLNRRTQNPPDPRRRSRGLLCMEALAHRTAGSAAAALSVMSTADYNPFNLLIADAEDVWIVSNPSSRLLRTRLQPGLHLLTNLDVDDPECPRIAASTQRFAALVPAEAEEGGADEIVARLQSVLSSHDIALDPRDAVLGNGLCVHLETFGTRSSTILLLDRHGKWTYRHCSSAPCRGHYRSEPAAEQFALQRRRA